MTSDAARFEIAIDGTVRAGHGDRAQAIEAAISMKRDNPSAGVTVLDVLTGEMLVIIRQPSCSLICQHQAALRGLRRGSETARKRVSNAVVYSMLHRL